MNFTEGSTSLPISAVVTSWLYRIVGTFIVCAGTIGNLLVILVFARKSMRRTPVYIGFIYLSVVDTLNLYIFPLPGIVSSIMGVDVRAGSSETCALFWFLAHTLSAQSVWTLAILIIERTMVVLFPLTSPELTKSRLILELAITTLINAGINVHMIFGRKAFGEGSNRTCIYGGSPEYLMFVNRAQNWINLVRGFALPFAIFLICNSALILSIRKSRKALARFSVNENSMSDSRNRTLRQNVNSTIIILVASSLQFSILSLPIFLFMCILRVGPHYEELNTVELRSTYSMLILIFYCNIGLNCFTYYVSSRSFRRELAKAIGRKLTRMNQSNALQTVSCTGESHNRI